MEPLGGASFLLLPHGPVNRPRVACAPVTKICCANRAAERPVSALRVGCEVPRPHAKLWKRGSTSASLVAPQAALCGCHGPGAGLRAVAAKQVWCELACGRRPGRLSGGAVSRR